MKLYTKQGDGGSTGLFLGGRISKSDLRCEAYGLVDTAVSAMGLARAFSSNNNVKEIIKSVQLEMFTVGSELAVEKDSYEKFRSEFGIVTEKMISNLEEKIDSISKQVKLPPFFIIPGTSQTSAALDVARSTVRTAERRVVELREKGQLYNNRVLIYLNRVSDLLFILGRLEDKDMDTEIVNQK
ncbi:MAG: cob(I)yrinic acid a,c-diamide adenosyltransferase [SAR202 cluster bacterium]|nr:cob(I)yrinic acid a,c-diamide adenosyltransferase [SAR202 cluster bacterium]|tara:strand:+ start:2894 stop:3445 length:552 start_codon:yes stop_codon:yes gene_type:complete